MANGKTLIASLMVPMSVCYLRVSIHLKNTEYIDNGCEDMYPDQYGKWKDADCQSNGACCLRVSIHIFWFPFAPPGKLVEKRGV